MQSNISKHFSELINSINLKMVRRPDGSFSCTDCEYVTKYRTTCQNHIESKHIITSGFTCQFCEKFCPTRNALKSHTTKNHKEHHSDFQFIRS